MNEIYWLLIPVVFLGFIGIAALIYERHMRKDWNGFQKHQRAKRSWDSAIQNGLMDQWRDQ